MRMLEQATEARKVRHAAGIFDPDLDVEVDPEEMVPPSSNSPPQAVADADCADDSIEDAAAAAAVGESGDCVAYRGIRHDRADLADVAARLLAAWVISLCREVCNAVACPSTDVHLDFVPRAGAAEQRRHCTHEHKHAQRQRSSKYIAQCGSRGNARQKCSPRVVRPAAVVAIWPIL